MKDDNKVLKFIYTLFLGALIAMFVGFGVNTFYVPPKVPEYPTSSMAYKTEPSAEQLAAEQKYSDNYNDYNARMKTYSRDTSIITLAAAVLLIALSLVFLQKIRLLADGIMMGGLFTLMYSIIRSFMSENSKYIFVTISVGLAVVLVLGYRRFVHPENQASKKPTKRS